VRFPARAVRFPARAVRFPARAVRFPARAVRLPARAVRFPAPEMNRERFSTWFPCPTGLSGDDLNREPWLQFVFVFKHDPGPVARQSGFIDDEVGVQ
jgi:hypothetical protein